MYDDHQRATTKQIVLTFGAIIGMLVAVIVVGGMLLSALVAPSPPATQAATPAPVVSPAPPPAKPATESATPSPTPTPVPPVAVKTEVGVVVIDAGHQAKGDSSLEPVGPGASERKAKVAGGTRGTVTKNPESLVNLQVALKLGAELERRGVKVIQVRTEQNVNVSNSARAEVANNANADLFIRLHCDGAGSSNQGLSTLIPGKNQWTGPILAESAEAGSLVHKAVIARSGAKDRGVVRRTDLSGFNWSKVPTILVEMGFMTNATEDRKLGSPDYQQKLAEGMADGIVKYLESN